MIYPKISIIILVWNNYTDTKECLESLEIITYPNYKIIIVDNDSKDNSTPRIQKEFPQHTYLYNKDNLGFTGGNNVGMEYAIKKGTDFVLILNNDVTVEKNFLELLVNVSLTNPAVGIVGPRINYFYEPDKLCATGFKINYWRSVTTDLIHSPDPTEVDWVYGCCLLIKREVIEKIGYLYDPYFLSYEDTDYCVQAKNSGFKVIYQPQTKIWHKVGASVGKSPVYFYYYFYRNKLLFFRRNAPFPIKYIFVIYFSIYLIFRIIENLVKKEPVIALALKDAIIDFWKGNYGKKKN